jgi:glycerophosphoryl diester phosphodiesterase
MRTCLVKQSLVLIVLLGTGSSLWSQDTARDKQTAPMYALDPQTPRGLRDLFRYTQEPLPLVSAHRGGAGDGLPENCIATFEETLNCTWAVLEVDPRFTKDGEIVLHHDATLDRTTTGTGPLREHTLEELKLLRLKDPSGNVTEHRIPTLDEALEWARGRTILILDQKDVPVEDRVRKIEEHRAEAYAMLIVYSFEHAKRCHRLNPNIMMEVMIPNRDKLREFEATGIPWSNTVAFIGHEPPQDRELVEMIHARGTCCFAGTSRNLDLTFAARHTIEPVKLQQDYQKLLNFGVDVLETDLPRDVGTLLYKNSTAPKSRLQFFRRAAR